jgi:hypothetical protein
MAEKTLQPSLESLKTEYAQVNENFRHFSTLRFAIFSAFFAVQAGLLTAAFGCRKLAPNTDLFAKVGGLLITFVFWGYQERNIRLIAHFMHVAVKLEHQLGYAQISTRPPAKFPVPDINTITRLFFFLMFIFWSCILIGHFLVPLSHCA